MTDLIKTRFAPSPTGHLHIGGARTALFNWLFARRTGGRFVLRIEDTDIERNVPGAEAKIAQDLDWLGLAPDESPWTGGPDKPYRQSERLDLYRQYAERLLDAGRAYYAFDTPEELAALREQAKREKKTFKYRRPAALPTRADADRARAQGRPVVVRMSAPDRDVTVDDHILGPVTIRADEMEDFIILKGNGYPTYHFAVVVDDELMHITHVLRAQEHLMNTPKHLTLQDALGFRRPIYGHMPIVMNMDGTKMSKRDKHKAVRLVVQEKIKKAEWTPADLARLAGIDDDAATRWLDRADVDMSAEQLARVARTLHVHPPEIEVFDFRKAGYLPEVVLNFIALLGWSPGENREKMTLADMVGLFSIDRISKTSARFDRDKLLAFNTDALAQAAPDRLRAGFRDYAQAGGSPLAGLDDATLTRVLELCRGMRTFADIDLKVGPLFMPDDQIRYDPDAVKKVLEKNDRRGYATLERLLPALEAHQDWSAAALESFVKDFCETSGLKMGDVSQPLRVAITGHTISPPIGETLSLLGHDPALRRIRACLAHARA